MKPQRAGQWHSASERLEEISLGSEGSQTHFHLPGKAGGEEKEPGRNAPMSELGTC